MSSRVVMPQLGQAMVTGLVVEWHVEDGDHAQAGSPLVTIESDKSAFEIDAPASGLVRHVVPAGAEADVGALLATIGESARPEAPSAQSARPAAVADSAARGRGRARPVASPRARSLAAGRIDLETIVASSPDGIISAADVERELAGRSGGAGGERQIDAGRRSAIRRLQTSWREAPHIVQMIEVDATRLVEAKALIRSGKLAATLNDIFIKAAADAMADFPDLNGYVDGDIIRYADEIGVSLAVATDRGLRTPLIEGGQGVDLEEIAVRVREAVDVARAGRSTSARASLTISNLGQHGIHAGTPVLNLHEAVLVFVGEIAERPVARDGLVTTRHALTLSIAYDHRIADGLRAAEFSAALRRNLERFDLSKWTDGVTPPPRRLVQIDSGGGLRCSLTSGRHRWSIDEPVALGGTDTAPDPVQMFLSSLLGCLTISLRACAQRRKIAIDHITGTIEANPSGKLKDVALQLTVRSDAPVEKVEALLKPAKAACYVHDLLRRDLKLDIALRVDPGAGS